MKISAKTKDCRLMVKVKTSFHEAIDEKELDRFARVFLRCFLKPKLLKKNTVEYSGPIGITLQERMKKEITKRDFLFILEHIVVAVQKLQANNFPLHNLKMSMQHIYINETTRELQFLYIPVVEADEHASIIDLFNAVIYSAHPAQETDTEYVSRFSFFFDGLQPFSIEKIEQFINREDRSVVNTIKKHNAGQSGFMTSKHKHYLEYLDEQHSDTEEKKDTQDDDPTGLLNEVVDDPTGLLNGTDDAVTGYLDEDVTGLLDDDAPTGYLNDDDEPTGYLNDDEQTGLLTDSESAGVLMYFDEESTALLAEETEGKTVFFPELFRVLTEETIKLDKPVFRIGKERSYVDYFVTNNNAISRSHADIITRESGYFVVDLNSKNRTYINDVPLAVQEETRIADGDLLRLGNEEFIFHIGNVAGSLPACPNCKAQTKPGSRFCAFCGTKL